MKKEFYRYISSHEKLRFFLKVIKKFNDPKFVHAVNHMQDGAYVVFTEKRGERNRSKLLFEIKLDSASGFCAVFRHILDNLYVAWIMGAYPVISISDNFPYYEIAGVDGNTNPWEYYFEQYEGMTLKDVENSFRVVPHYDRSASALFGESISNGYLVTEKYIDILAPVMRKYIKLNKKTEEKIQGDIKNLLKDRKTLGVQIRMGDMMIGANGHPKVPSLDEYITEIKKALQQYDFECIFLATDDERGVKRVREEFGNKVVYYEDVIRVKEMLLPFEINVTRDKHKYLCGLEVLRDMYTLAASDGLVAGNSQVSICSRICKKSKKEKFCYEKIINKGINNTKLTTDSRKFYQIKENEKIRETKAKK